MKPSAPAGHTGRASTDIGSTSTPAQVRAAARSGAWTGHTSGLAERHVQGNLVVLPQAQATDFLRFCQRNPKPCPLLAVGEPGNPRLPMLCLLYTSRCV